MVRNHFRLICVLLFSFSAELGAIESTSIDPNGQHYLVRKGGDTFNCGPLTALMARQFADKEFKVSSTYREIEKARSLVNSYEKKQSDYAPFSWWKFSDIETYLKFTGVDTRRVKFLKGRNQISQITNSISEKKLLIVNVNMNHLPRGNNTGKPYNTFYIPGGWGHYLAIIGFERKNDEIFFETHDSFSLRGRNRFYSANQLVRAMNLYAPVYLEVDPTINVSM